MEQYDVWIWVGIIVLSLVVEMVSMDMTSIWFAVGAFITLLLAAIGIGLELQIVTFIIVSLVSILTLRKWTKNKLLNSSTERAGLDLLKAERFKLMVEITETQKGAVKYNDVVWTAISFDGKPIGEGEWVTVEEIKGNKLIVKKEGK